MPQLRLSDEKIQKIRDLLGTGLSQRKIATLAGCSQGAVNDIANNHYKSGPAAADMSGKFRAEIKDLEGELRQAREQIVRLEKAARLGEGLSAAQRQVPEWQRRSHRPSRSDAAVATAFLSDLHLDEVVDPKQVGGVNAYNRGIAEKRLRKFFDSTLQLTFDHMKGIKIEGLVLPLGGDIFSGNIHEELRLTNEATMFQSMLYWSEKLAAGIQMVASEFKSVHIPCVVGNHGRTSHKPVAKNRPQDNFDWFLYHLLARFLKDVPNITWSISESADEMFRIYDTTFLLTHGDQFRGGGGISGLLSPLMIGSHRKSKRQQAIRRPYDWMVMGHWHQYSMFKGIIVNGSLKGYDEYAFISNFDFEPPRQAYWLTQPRHGITISGPLHVISNDESIAA